MTEQRIASLLEAQAPGAWELYQKEGASREITRTANQSCETSRKEEGFAARWWDPALRFAAASSAAGLARLIPLAAGALAAPGPVPRLPTGRSDRPTPPGPLEAPPDLFEELTRLVSAESRGEAALSELSVRCGRSLERVRNAPGLDVSWSAKALTGFAAAVGRRGGRACEARVLFRWDGEPALAALARRLCDRTTLPLSERATAVERGEWLLDVSVTAALLSGLAPLFTAEARPRWAARGALLPPEISIVDDATGEAPFDGEGTPSRRVLVVDRGALGEPLHDLSSARRAGATSTGHGVRHSYRTPPVRAARRLFFETQRPVSPRDLLASVKRGVFASALIAPFACDLANDRYEAQFTGVTIVAGRAQSPVSAARARGRLSELLQRVAALSPGEEFFPMPDLVGGATLLVDRVSFE